MSASDASSVPVLPDWSAYAGEAFDLSERRPLTILAEDERAIIAEGFFFRGQFWKAVISKQGVSEIVGQRLNFSKPKRQSDGSTRSSLFFLNHVQARLKMDPGHEIALYSLQAAPNGEPTHRVSDFSYSVEAVGPHGRKWNVSDALLGNLAVVHRFLSTEDVAFERIMLARMKIVQSPPLPLEQDTRNTMLHAAIRQSSQAGLSRPYFMFRAPLSATNCSSEPLRLLDGVMSTPGWQRFFYRFPVYPRGYLQLRGLWQDGQQVPTLNEQMADWLASEQAKERRHIYLGSKKQHSEQAVAHNVSWWKNLSTFFKATRA